ncbi:hypothetical protein BDZ97DRAFT_2057545 [Flammula alnicola]|nr:hypothetical protein BDZ97DRAFT_2057545 [Flammula alnicola]
MRLTVFFSVVFLGLAIGVVNAQAQPRSAHNTLHHISRAELTAREANPELFRKRDSGSPSPSGSPGGGNICDFTAPARRDTAVAEQVLTAAEMAAFLMGRGSFISSNGTQYIDEEYAETLRRAANSHRGFYHRVYNVVKDSLGNKLLEISIPHYKKWKSTLAHGELVYLSSSTGIRAQDIDKLEQNLIADPAFTDIQVHGFRISRKFFEVATSY